MEKPILASELISALSNPQRGLKNYHGGKYSTAMTRNLQIGMVQCQKFVLSNNLLDHATRASYVEPKYLLSAVDNCIPAFNNMWIEWDEHKRIVTGRQEITKLLGDDKVQPLSLDEQPDRVGYHIQRIHDKYLYTCYYKENGIFRSPEMGFDVYHEDDFTYEDYTRVWEKHNPDMNMPQTSMDRQVFDDEVIRNGRVLMSDGYCEYYKDDPNLYKIFKRLAPSQTSATHWTRSAKEFETPMTEKDARHHGNEIRLITGDARFMISLLNILNYDLVTTEDVVPPRKVTHLFLSRSVPKNEYKLVEIDLPKPRGKKVYKRIFTGQGSPKREHWRRGHWRRVVNKQGVTVKRIWIGEQKVGNKELGTIIHDYVLKSSDK
jgi:hypothetical protein